MNKIKISWKEFKDLVEQLDKKILRSKVSYIYGIPRGGQYVALMLSEISGIPMTNEITEDTIIVDDVADSGSTLARYHGKGCGVATLHVKPHSVVKPHFWVKETEAWLIYPWETNSDETIKDSVLRILELIGENPNREGIKYTPHRVARLYNNLFYGYRKKLVVMNEEERNTKLDKDVIPITVFKNESDEMLIRQVNCVSHCEHHIAIFPMRVWVGIIPDKKLMGMNKIDKVVKYFAARLQIQERMTNQIASWINDNIEPKGVIVVIKGVHYCAELQGDSGNFTTSAVKGIFLNPEPNKDPKSEFLKLIDMAK